MKIKVYVIFSSLLCVNVFVNAMHHQSRLGYIDEILWEKHQNERYRYYQKLGIPVPDELANQTYQEAMVQHLKNKAHNTAGNEQSMREAMRQQETQKK